MQPASRPLATNPLRNVPVAVVGASNGAFGAVWAQAELRKVLATAGARVIEGDVAVGHAHERFDANGVLTDENLREQLDEVAEALVGAATLRELVAGGTKLSAFPQPVMEAAFAASNELYAELSAKNALFKKIYDQWRLFRNEEILWFRVCEGSFDNFMARMSAAGKL